MKGIVRIGFPTSVQSMLFTGISMIIARLVAGYGDAAVAVQKVGSQIESISWMTADGFAAAVNSFTSQNHGAGKKRRIYQGYVSALKVVFVWGIFCTLFVIMHIRLRYSGFLYRKRCNSAWSGLSSDPWCIAAFYES